MRYHGWLGGSLAARALSRCPSVGRQVQPRVHIIRQVHGDVAGPRSRREVSPWVRVSGVPGQAQTRLWLSWRLLHLLRSSVGLKGEGWAEMGSWACGKGPAWSRSGPLSPVSALGALTPSSFALWLYPLPGSRWSGLDGEGQQQNSRIFLGKCIQHLLPSPHCWAGRGMTVFFSLCTLPTALLHPGDKIIKEGEDIRQIRQPGGSCTTARDPAPSPVSTSRSRTASRKQAKEAENRFVQRGFRISSSCASLLCARSPPRRRRCRGAGVERQGAAREQPVTAKRQVLPSAARPLLYFSEAIGLRWCR